MANDDVMAEGGGGYWNKQTREFCYPKTTSPSISSIPSIQPSISSIPSSIPSISSVPSSIPSISSVPQRTNTIGTHYFGNTFDDEHTPWLHGKITQIELNYYSNVIRFIRITYASGKSYSHGNKYSSGSNHIIDLGENKHIVKVNGRYDTFIRQLVFKTNDGEVFGPYGGSGDTPFSFDFGANVLIYIFGRDGTFGLYQLGFAHISLSSTAYPTISPEPSSSPTSQPSIFPTTSLSLQPSISLQPSSNPSLLPSISLQPSSNPSSHPSSNPSLNPTKTSKPSMFPSSNPSSNPSIQPSIRPSIQLSSNPSSNPSSKPSLQPTKKAPPPVNDYKIWLDGESWDGSKWLDKSTNGHHSDNARGTINKALDQNNAMTYLFGNTDSGVTISSGWPSTNEYTLFHVTKYNGASKEIIWSDFDLSWASGHVYGKRGVFFQGGWVNDQNVGDVDSWGIFTDRATLYSSTRSNVRVDGVDVTKYPLYRNIPNSISINQHYRGHEMYSDWAAALVLVYDRYLNEDEVLSVEDWIRTEYLSTYTASPTISEVPSFDPTSISSNNGHIYEAEDPSNIFGDSEVNHDNVLGIDFVNMGGQGSWIEWPVVSAGSDGACTLKFRYALATSALNPRPCQILVNDVDVGSVGFPSVGGSWSDYGSDSIDIVCPSGSFKVRMTATSSNGGPNVDHLEVV